MGYMNYHQGRRPLPMPDFTEAQIKKFWSHVDKSDEHWRWVRSGINGVGQVYFAGKIRVASRVAYHLTNHNVTPKQLVLVRCGSKEPCLNPEHMKLVERETWMPPDDGMSGPVTVLKY